MLGDVPRGKKYQHCRCTQCRAHGDEKVDGRRVQRAREREEILDALVREAAEYGLYESTAYPRPTR